MRFRSAEVPATGQDVTPDRAFECLATRTLGAFFALTVSVRASAAIVGAAIRGR